MTSAVILLASRTEPGAWSILGMLGMIVAAFVLYPLPFFIAAYRDKRSKLILGVVNLFFGWTCLGWLICLAWAFTPDRP